MVVQDQNGVLTGLAILGITNTEIQGKVKCVVYNNNIQGTGIRDNEVSDATTMTEGETKIREARDCKMLHPGTPQHPLSEDRGGRAQEGLMEVIIWKTNFRRD
jgi:hypothetical protein